MNGEQMRGDQLSESTGGTGHGDGEWHWQGRLTRMRERSDHVIIRRVRLI
jgi:hypothetical protein